MGDKIIEFIFQRSLQKRPQKKKNTEQRFCIRFANENQTTSMRIHKC